MPLTSFDVVHVHKNQKINHKHAISRAYQYTCKTTYEGESRAVYINAGILVS